jgi:hypothetical protein
MGSNPDISQNTYKMGDISKGVAIGNTGSVKIKDSNYNETLFALKKINAPR